MPIADPGAGAATPAPPVDVETQKLSLEDGEGIINPLTFPEPSVSVDYVNAMASGLRELGTSIADTGNDITGSWAGLNGPYSAPEAETLFSVLDPVATDGDTVGEELDRAARALENFAEDVADIKTRWSNLRVEAYDLRSRIDAEGDDWDKGGGLLGFGDSPLVEENKALIEQGGKIITDYTEVENTCANAINDGISGRTQFEQHPEGDAELDPNVFYHGFEQDLSELAEAWGHESAQTDYGWWVDVSHSVWDFGVDAVEGVGAMVGAHSSEGWFQASWGDALKEYHWDNLTSAASLVGMYDAESDSLGWAGWGSVGEAWKDLAHSVVPWEEWGDRPGYVIGTAALNVIGLVGGAALTATGVGAVVGVPLMAWRGMSIVDGMGGSGRGGSGGGADIDLPDVSHVPQFGGSGSPLINLAGRALDATGYGPSQWADLKNMVNRLMPSGQSGAEPSGAGSTQTGGEAEGGRPGSARPAQTTTETDQRSIQRPAQDSAMDDPSEADTPAAADTRVSVGSDTGEAGSGRSGTARPAQTSGEVAQSPDQDSDTADRSESDRESIHSEDETESENLTDHLDRDESANDTDPEPRKDEVTEEAENSRAVSEDPNQDPRVSDVAEADSLLQSLVDSFTPEQRAGFENGERNLSGLEIQEPRPRLSDEQVNARIQSDPGIKNIDAEMHEKASNYPGFWESDPTSSTDKGPDRRDQLLHSGGRPDFDSAHAQGPGNPHGQSFNLRGSDGSLSDGDRVGERDTRNDGSSDSRDATRTRDHGPAASHNNDNPAPRKNSGPEDTPSPVRNQDGEALRSGRSELDSTSGQRGPGGTGDHNSTRHDGGDPLVSGGGSGLPRNESASSHGTNEGRFDGDEGSLEGTTRGSERPSGDAETGEIQRKDFEKDNDRDQPSRQFDGRSRGEVSREIAEEIGLNPDTPYKDFAKKFTDYLNEKITKGHLEYFKEFYNKDGSRFRIQRSILGFKIPQMTSVNGGPPWIALETLPTPDPPNYRTLNDRSYFSSTDSRNTGPDIDKFAEDRKEAIRKDLIAENELKQKRDEHKDYPGDHPEVLEKERIHKPLHRDMTKASETYGEEVAKVAVRDLFDGKHSIMGKDGNPIDLPQVLEIEPGKGLEPYNVEGAPKSGNYQFDQIWPLPDGGILIVEAKSSQSTSLNERVIEKGGGVKRVLQGTPDYLDATLKNMKERGMENPQGSPDELELAMMIEDARASGKLVYAEVKGITPGQREKALGQGPEDGEVHSGYSVGIFDIPKR